MPAPDSGRPALLVAAGIFLSRILGFVRQRAITHFLGTSLAADAVIAAFKAPNVLQNLLGEGVLSASFIPVYAGLLADGEEEQAGRVAGAVGGLLALACAAMVVIGILAAPVIVAVLSPGFLQDERGPLTVMLVRVLFPGTACFVMAAWCIGILNSHHRFFLSYAAPVAWNLAIIVALVTLGPGRSDHGIASIIAWSSLAGAVLQVLVQLPTVLRVEPRLRATLALHDANVRTVLRNFLPVLMGRGVVQVSGYVDQILASLLVAGAVAELGFAQTIAMLPVSLFGMAVSASELPAMSRERGSTADIATALRGRISKGLSRIGFFVVPSAVAFLALGDVVGGTLYQSGRFTAAATQWLWGILAGSAIGLMASTQGRLYASSLYALRDTRTPLRFAVIRVALTIVLGVLCAFPLPRMLGLDPKWGVAGLTASAGLAGWVEFLLLRRAVSARIGAMPVVGSRMVVLWLAGLIAAAVAWGVKLALGARGPLLMGACVLPTYGLAYFAATWAFGVPQARAMADRLRPRGRGRS